MCDCHSRGSTEVKGRSLRNWGGGRKRSREREREEKEKEREGRETKETDRNCLFSLN